MGKHKPIFDRGGTIFMLHSYPDLLSHPLVSLIFIADCGDYVTVTNARQILTSGDKANQKMYYSHSMYPGGLKEVPFKRLMERKPEEVRYISSSFHCTSAVEHYIKYLNRPSRRSFARQSLACFPKTNFENGDYSVCTSSKATRTLMNRMS